jgi:anaerobic ribonucleoside-triphosphate reductase activating protein
MNPEMDETFLPHGAEAPPSVPAAIRLGGFEPRSLVAGPGERAVIWVTGCLRRCPACMKPDWFDFATGTLTAVAELAALVLNVHSARPLRGVSFSGGEPFEQAEPLAALADLLHPAGLDVLTYSGYRLGALQESPRFRRLLQRSDWLIDAEYRREDSGPRRWRGSANQQLYVRGSDGTHRRVTADEGIPLREVQISLSSDALRLTGFPDAVLQSALRSHLLKRGLEMKEDRT